MNFGPQYPANTSYPPSSTDPTLSAPSGPGAQYASSQVRFQGTDHPTHARYRPQEISPHTISQESSQYLLQAPSRPYAGQASVPYPIHHPGPPPQGQAQHPTQTSEPYSSHARMQHPVQDPRQYTSHPPAPYPSQAYPTTQVPDQYQPQHQYGVYGCAFQAESGPGRDLSYTRFMDPATPHHYAPPRRDYTPAQAPSGRSPVDGAPMQPPPPALHATSIYGTNDMREARPSSASAPQQAQAAFLAPSHFTTYPGERSVPTYAHSTQPWQNVNLAAIPYTVANAMAASAPPVNATAVSQPPPNATAIPQPPLNATTASHHPPNATAIPQPPPNAAAASHPPPNATAVPHLPPNATAVPQPPLNSGTAIPTATSSAPPEQQIFIPLDMGPSATYEDVAAMWQALCPEDRQILIQMYLDTQRAAAQSMDVDQLFTIGSANPPESMKGKAKKPTRSVRRQQRGAGPNSRAPLASAPSDPSPAASSAHVDPSAAASSAKVKNPGRPFKSPTVEDYYSSESDDEEDAMIPSHEKGKGRATDRDAESPTPEPTAPTLNVRPGGPPALRNAQTANPFGVVLNAFHVMGERMERLEISMTQGLKRMDDKMSEMGTGSSVQPPQVTLRRKGPNAVTRIIAAKTGKQQTSRAAGSSTHVPPGPAAASAGERNAWPPQMPSAFQAPNTYVRSHGAQPPSTSTPAPPHVSTAHGVLPGTQPPPASGYGGGLGAQPPMSTEAGSTAVPHMSEEDTKEALKLYRKYMRRHLWDELLKIKGAAQLPERCPPVTEDEYEQYLRIKEKVINLTNFRIDFTRGWVRSKFNVEARSYAAWHFVACVRGGMYQKPPLPLHWITEDMAAEILDKVMVHIFRLYNQECKPETVNKLAKEVRDMERKRADTRRSTLLKWRVETLINLKLDHHLVLFTDMDAAHLSSDEPAFGRDQKQAHYQLYYIIEAAWQSRAFKKFVHDLDRWYIYYSRPKVGEKQRGGNRPRVREQLPKGKARVVDSVAPRGLWRNCYDADWLKTLKATELESLHMIDEDYDFTLPPPPPIPEELLPLRGTTLSSETHTISRPPGGAGSSFLSPPDPSIPSQGTTAQPTPTSFPARPLSPSSSSNRPVSFVPAISSTAAQRPSTSGGSVP